MGCMIPQPFATGGNRSYLEFWVVTGSPRYSGYFTPTIAPEPSVERVVKNILSMGGRIGAYVALPGTGKQSRAAQVRAQHGPDRGSGGCLGLNLK
jgi:hypothetical protein